MEPDYFQVTMDYGETLLLCSDGLYNMVSEKEKKKVVNSDLSLRAKAEKLIRMANAAGGKDNIAVVLITED